MGTLRPTRCIGVFVLAALVASSPLRAADEDRRLNVLFIIADDLNCDLGCYGHRLVQSPHIDRLAAEGLRFERAYCQFPLCGPSRAATMCGLYPDQTLIRQNAIRIRQRIPNVLTLPQLFRNHGYTAVRVGKIYHYGVPTAIGTDGHDDPDSWEKVINPRGRDKDDEAKIFSLRPGQFGGTLSWLAADGADQEQTDGIGATAAVDLLEQFAREKTRFFLAVGFYRPHTPYVAPKKYFDQYPLEKITVPRLPEGYFDTLPKPARDTLTTKKDQFNLPDELARQAIQAYYASITFMDAQVGRVLDALRRLELDQNTVVLFTSDHGYHMGSHGHYQKMTLFEDATHVPLIIALPGMRTAGQSTASLAEMVDFYPTLAELCGLSPPGHLSGASLAKVLDDPGSKPRGSAFTQHANGYTIRTERYRYTQWGADGSDGAELYDHHSDPAEMTNLADRPQFKPIVAELSEQLRERIAKGRQVPAGLVQTPAEQGERTGRKVQAGAGSRQ